MLKKIFRKFGPNPLDQLLKKAQKKERKTFLIFWNRGLGDIALGLYAIIHRIREFVPNANITFVTRENLRDGFALLKNIEVIVIPNLKRGDQVDLSSHIDLTQYDVVIEKADPTHWVKGQLGKLTPKLHWQKKWDQLCQKFDLDPNTSYIGAHVQTETNYASWRDWPAPSWHRLFEKITQNGQKVLLFGFGKEPQFPIDGVIDLRGETDLFELLSIIKNHCKALIVPDSGISSMVYFLEEDFPIHHISLWADPYMGILKQNVASPNKNLKHIPLIGKDKNITNITVDQVYEQIPF